MGTGLQLLMTDGAVYVTFKPRLTAEQYATLMAMLEDVTMKDELRRAGARLAEEWGVEFHVDDLSV
jgi:hypothetical protein